jgi:hypothetical protein
MRRLLATMLLSLACSTVHAEWIQLSQSEDEVNTNFVDPSTIRKSGNVVKLWVMSDYTVIQSFAGSDYLSTVHQDEYDCKNEMGRVIYVSFYKNGKAKGVSFDKVEQPQSKWRPIQPQTMTQSLFNYACSK